MLKRGEGDRRGGEENGGRNGGVGRDEEKEIGNRRILDRVVRVCVQLPVSFHEIEHLI